MKVTIVGAGITGLISAHMCSKRGFEVEVFERFHRPGGIMCDIHADDAFFLNGCHYFDRGTPWFEELANDVDYPFVEFVHEYGSLTEINASSMVHSDFAQPVLEGKFPGLFGEGKEYNSVSDRLDYYGPQIAASLKDWASGFGDLETLSSQCSVHMQLARMFFPDDLDTVLKAKQESALNDEFLGVPRTVLFPDSPKEIGVLPVHGFDHFFDFLQSLLIERGVKFNFRTPVAAVTDERGRLEFRAGGQRLISEKMIWCCNPVPLILSSGVGRMDAPFSKMFCAVGEFVGEAPEVPTYFHVFSKKSSVTRIFWYDLEGQKLTIEGFDRGQSASELIDDINRVALKCGHAGEFVLKEVQQQKRYSSFTCKDLDLIRQFADRASELGIVDGKWQCYSRDQKIDGIAADIQKWETD